MNKRKVLPVLSAAAVVISICFSIFAVAYVASADNSATVRLVSMDYIEQTLMPLIDDKISQGSVANMQETISAINKTIDYLNGQVSQNTTDISSLESEIANLKEAMKTVQEEMDLLKDTSDQGAISGAFTALKERVDALEQTVAVLTQDVTSLKGSMSSVIDRVSALEGTVSSLKSYAEEQIAALTGRVSVNEQNITALSTVAETMKGDLNTVKSQYSALNASYNALNQRYAALESDNTTQRSELAQMKSLLITMENKLAGMTHDYGELVDAYNDYTKTLAALKEATGNGSMSFSAIFLKEGEKLTFAGLPGDTMELIVRRGDVAVVSPYPTQGLLDVTDSTELLNGKNVPTYHYMLLVGGSDGRGIVSVTGDAWILVRGDYEIG